MPQLAYMINTYQPQPDPVTEQMRQLQVAMLQAQVNNEQSKADENSVDKELKGAKVQTELAKAKNINSTADKTDLDYIQQYAGVQQKAELQKQQLKNQFDIDRETLKLLQGNTQRYL